MKPEKIDWKTFKAFGELPERKTLVLLSYNNASMHNFQAASTEGYYGDPSIDFPEIPLSENDEDFFNTCGSSFYNKEGNAIPSVYAWAYKPESMLGKGRISI